MSTSLRSSRSAGAQHRGTGVITQPLLAPATGQRRVCLPKLPRQISVKTLALPGEMEQRLEPEVGDAGNLLTLFHEPNRQQASGKLVVGPYLRGDASQKHGLSPSARTDNEDVLARCRLSVPAQDFEHHAAFVVANHELVDDVLVGLEYTGICLADRRVDPLTDRDCPGHYVCPPRPSLARRCSSGT